VLPTKDKQPPAKQTGVNRDAPVSRWSVVIRLSTSWPTLVLCLFLVAGLSLAHWVDSLGGALPLLDEFGHLAPLVTVPIQALIAVTPLPSGPICVANGSVYGLWLGALLNWIGWGLASAIQYEIGRRMGIAMGSEAVSELPDRITRFPFAHPAFLILGRAVPYAGDAISLAAGAAQVSFWRFGWCTAIALVPLSLGSAALGAGIVTVFW